MQVCLQSSPYRGAVEHSEAALLGRRRRPCCALKRLHPYGRVRNVHSFNTHIGETARVCRHGTHKNVKHSNSGSTMSRRTALSCSGGLAQQRRSLSQGTQIHNNEYIHPHTGTDRPSSTHLKSPVAATHPHFADLKKRHCGILGARPNGADETKGKIGLFGPAARVYCTAAPATSLPLSMTRV